jgi:ribose transport system substrate-binding protein
MSTSASIDKADAFKAAAKVLGWNVKVVDGQGSVTGWNSAILSALALHPDGMILDSILPTQVKAALAKVHQAGIPIVALDDDVPPGPGLADAEVGISTVAAADATSALVAQNSGDHAHVLFYDDQGESKANPSTQVWTQALKSVCSGCSVDSVQEASYLSAANTMASTISGILQANPQINYISIPYGELLPYAVQGINQAGRRGKVKIVDQVCTAPDATDIMSGGPDIGCVATTQAWGSWQAADDLLRIFDHLPVNSDFQLHPLLPARLFTKENMYKGEFWSGDYDYQAAFERLWGVS